jgi:hypothetical protein
MDLIANPTVIFFIANALYVISYVVTSMLWLRILAVIAALSTFPYFFFQAEPLWSALFWQCTFLLVNLVNLVILVLSMRTPNFDALESAAYELKFSGMKPHEAVPILRASGRVRLQDHEQLLTEGRHNENLYLLVHGSCRVSKNGIDVAILEPGNFVGEFSFTSGDVTNANVFSDGESELLSWSKESVEKLSRRHMLYASYLHQLCNADLAAKLRAMTTVSSDNMNEIASWLLDEAGEVEPG